MAPTSVPAAPDDDDDDADADGIPRAFDCAVFCDIEYEFIALPCLDAGTEEELSDCFAC